MIIGKSVLMNLAEHSSQNKVKNMFFGWEMKEIQLFYYLHNLPMINGTSLPMIIGTVVLMVIGTMVPIDLAEHSSQNKVKNMFFA